jgi:hypothetical protein
MVPRAARLRGTGGSGTLAHDASIPGRGQEAKKGGTMLYRGSCHCGENAYEVEGDIGQVVECNCSYCSRKGYLLWFVPRNQLRLTTPEMRLAIYTFNKHVIKHHFCPECGCSPFGLGVAPNGLETAAINVRCLEGVDVAELRRVPFDGRGV